MCPKCGVEMKVVSVITDPDVVDRILRHLEKNGGRDPFEPRAPPSSPSPLDDEGEDPYESHDSVPA